MSETELAAKKQQALKKWLKSQSFEVFDNYPCRWEDNRLTGLDQFAQRVFLNLFNSITRHDNLKNEENLDELGHLIRVNEAHVTNIATATT